MALIAQNHLQFIIEVAIIIYTGVIFVINFVPISLSAVLFGSMVLGVGLTLLFGLDVGMLFLSFSQSEFSHPLGPIALLGFVTALAAFPMMEKVGINVRGLKTFVYIFIVLITIFGGLVHRSFLFLWLLGLLIGYFIISKSFRQKSVLTLKRILIFAAVTLAGFGALEWLSELLKMPVFSPLLRIARLEENAVPSLKMVLKNTTLFGHLPTSSYWPSSTGFGDGYISLPISMVLMFALPFPVFYGLLVNKKDVVDYFLPGTFGYAYDFGYVTLFFLLIWCIGVILIGFKILSIYREKRENGNRSYLGKEALLIGSLTAFIAQALVGLFIINRTINGMALVTFIFLSALIVSNIITVKKDEKYIK
ncbi:hypothetical protein [Methanobacterium alcaliphilum]|uniref:hypothetical protein n=1 Tax=Methanobacterium alcaliphilum TaxID=392018 RepID=UPI00200A483D|nr:hypothetical protein [Methanobacterium alcaliphilum]MCK9150837.1 hypothetical protein [Methanobacterium alcaliphilum]